MKLKEAERHKEKIRNDLENIRKEYRALIQEH